MFNVYAPIWECLIDDIEGPFQCCWHVCFVRNSTGVTEVMGACSSRQSTIDFDGEGTNIPRMHIYVYSPVIFNAVVDFNHFSILRAIGRGSYGKVSGFFILLEIANIGVSNGASVTCMASAHFL